jgi:branched-chain amino acid transport system substrate-binding protein
MTFSTSLKLAAISIVALAAASGGANAQQEPIKIGAVLSLTGAAAGLGVPERNGALAAEKAINAKGGIKGRPIKLIIEDDTTNPDTAVTKVNGLIYNEKVLALLGATNLGPTVAIGGITDKIKLPQFAFTGLGPDVEKQRNCVFHMFTSHELNARALLGYVTDALKAKRVAVLHDSGYGTVVMREFSRVQSQYPVEVVAVEKFELSATDVTPQSAKIKAANPDAIIVMAVQAAPFRSIRDLQMTQPIVALNGASSYEIVGAMGNAADNVIYPEFLVYEDPLPHQKEFVEYMMKNFNQRAKNPESVAWDALHVIARAMEKVGPDAGNEKLCEAIRSEPYKGVTTDYNFGAPDMTGIKQSGYLFSKLIKGQYTRTDYRLKD